MWAPSPFYSQATGSDDMSPPDEWIPFVDIITDSLAYWDKDIHCWRNYPGGEIYRPAKVEASEIDNVMVEKSQEELKKYFEYSKPWWKFW